MTDQENWDAVVAEVKSVHDMFNEGFDEVPNFTPDEWVSMLTSQLGRVATAITVANDDRDTALGRDLLVALAALSIDSIIQMQSVNEDQSRTADVVLRIHRDNFKSLRTERHPAERMTDAEYDRSDGHA